MTWLQFTTICRRFRPFTTKLRRIRKLLQTELRGLEMRTMFDRALPVLSTLWVATQSRLPSILLTLSSFEMTIAMVIGMFLAAAKRKNQLA